MTSASSDDRFCPSSDDCVAQRRASPMSVQLEKLPRCCPRHDDWVTLGEHLATDFPAVTVGALLHDLVDARVTTERLGLEPAEALDIAELMVRHKLMLATGQLPDGARLDPQNHSRRRTEAQASERP